MTGDAMSESKHHDDLRARIADVLRLHQWRATVRTSDDDPVLDCSCGVAFGGALDCQRGAFDSHREHVADAVIRELTTAYVVTSGNYSDYQVLRVYLTREEADQFVELRGTIRGYEECRIEEFPIGSGCAEYDGPGYRASWSITQHGTESEHLMETWLTGSYLRPVEKRGIQRNYRRFVMVEGIDRDQVLKVLRDAATQGRAEYEGVSSNFTFRSQND